MRRYYCLLKKHKKIGFRKVLLEYSILLGIIKNTVDMLLYAGYYFFKILQ